MTSPDVRDGLVESAGCDPGFHYRPAHVWRRGGLGHPEGWNSPAAPQPWLHSPAFDWGFPRFLTTPLTWGGRSTGLPGWRPSYLSVSLKGGGERRAIREPPGRPSRLTMPWAGAQAGQSCPVAWCAPGSVPELTAVVTRKVLKALSALFGLVLTLEERSLNVPKWQRRKSVLNRYCQGFSHLLGRGRPHRLTPQVPLWWRGLQQDEEGPSLVTGIGNGEVELGMAKTVLRIASEFMVLSQYAADTASEVWSDPPPMSWGSEGKALESPDRRCAQGPTSRNHRLIGQTRAHPNLAHGGSSPAHSSESREGQLAWQHSDSPSPPPSVPLWQESLSPSPSTQALHEGGVRKPPRPDKRPLCICPARGVI